MRSKRKADIPTIAEESALLAIGTRPLIPATAVPIEQLLQEPHYSSTAYKVYERRGNQTFFYHIVSWPMTHWWDLQDWINRTQYELERIYGPIIHLVNTQIQNHDGKPLMMGFYQIGPVSPMISPAKIGNEWRKFIDAISEF